MKPDVRFKVFNQEFYLHSTVLKLHSEFFVELLDSPDEAYFNDKARVKSQFQYEWVSRIVAEGKAWWHLAASDPPAEVRYSGSSFLIFGC